MIYFGVAVIACFVGVFIGAGIMYFFGEPRCKHIWEKIIDEPLTDYHPRTVVHMCSKCGKRKITRLW